MKNASELIGTSAFAVEVSGAGHTGQTIPGLTICPISEAFSIYGNDIATHFLQASHTTNGIFVRVDDSVHIDKPLYITSYGQTTDNTCLIIAGKNSSSTIIFMVGSGNIDRMISVDEDAEIVVRDIIASEAEIRLNSATRLAAKAWAETVTIEYGTAETRLSYLKQLAGREAHAEHYGIFMAADGENKSIDVRVEHLVPDCKSDVLIKGVAAGSGRGSFKGMVYVAQDAQHTEAYQQSRNLLIGSQARITTTPQLEIYADDVRCSHGATVGQMNDDAVYYMRQRGLSDSEARSLQLAGFVNDIVQRLGDNELAGKVAAEADSKIERL